MRFLQGWTKVSLLDYPGYICSVVFIAGCNLRCPYCHNRELLNKDMCRYRFDWEEILQWLLRNRQMIDGVCFTGGEPTLYEHLESMIYDVKELNLKVKLDTNGTESYVLKRLLQLQLLDYVAMDIKAPLNRYAQICRAHVNLDSIRESVELIKLYAPNYEFRTTFHPSLLSIRDFYQICEWLKGVSTYVIQSCRIGNNLDPLFNGLPPVDYEDVKSIADLCKNYFPRFVLRGFTASLKKPLTAFVE